jgi:hypothetical protein
LQQEVGSICQVCSAEGTDLPIERAITNDIKSKTQRANGQNTKSVSCYNTHTHTHTITKYVSEKMRGRAPPSILPEIECRKYIFPLNLWQKGLSVGQIKAIVNI